MLHGALFFIALIHTYIFSQHFEGPPEICKQIINYAINHASRSNPARLWTFMWCLDKIAPLDNNCRQLLSYLSFTCGKKLIKYKGYIQSGIISAAITFPHLSDQAQSIVKVALLSCCPIHDRLKIYVNELYLFKSHEKIEFDSKHTLNFDQPSLMPFIEMIKKSVKKIEYVPETTCQDPLWKLDNLWKYQARLKLNDGFCIWAINSTQLSFNDLLALYIDLFFNQSSLGQIFYIYPHLPEKIDAYTRRIISIFKNTTSRIKFFDKQQVLKNINDIRQLRGLPIYRIKSDQHCRVS